MMFPLRVPVPVTLLFFRKYSVVSTFVERRILTNCRTTTKKLLDSIRSLTYMIVLINNKYKASNHILSLKGGLMCRHFYISKYTCRRIQRQTKIEVNDILLNSKVEFLHSIKICIQGLSFKRVLY